MVKNFSKVEYVWIDADGNTRSKCRTIKNENHRELFVNDLPIWNYDGSSTGQAIGSDSEVYIRPVKLYSDPSVSIETLWIKSQLVNSRLLLNDSIQLDIHLAIISYLLKDNFDFIYSREKQLTNNKDDKIIIYFSLKEI